MISAALVGLFLPDEGAGEVLPLADDFSVFSTALAATTLAAFSAGGVSDLAGSALLDSVAFAGAGVPIERTLALGAGASPPIDRTLAFGAGASPPMLRTFGAPSFVVIGLLRAADVLAGPAEPSVGRFAIDGVCAGCWDAVAPCCWP